MKTYKFWSNKLATIKVGSKNQVINILCGSNESKEMASNSLDEKVRIIEARIGHKGKFESYEVDIRESVVNEIDRNNIITVCRYGALVLNTTEYAIYDLDQYRWEFLDLFRSYRGMSKKEIIVKKFLKRAVNFSEKIGKSFRIYETCKGIRVIGKKYYDPKDTGFNKVLRGFSVDWIYSIMCQKQGCYRARLTPKPYRMKLKPIKIGSPLDCETATYEKWKDEYVVESLRFRVVRLIMNVGDDFSLDPVIKYHDEITNEKGRLRLA